MFPTARLPDISHILHSHCPFPGFQHSKFRLQCLLPTRHREDFLPVSNLPRLHSEVHWHCHSFPPTAILCHLLAQVPAMRKNYRFQTAVAEVCMCMFAYEVTCPFPNLKGVTALTGQCGYLSVQGFKLICVIKRGPRIHVGLASPVSELALEWLT